MSKNLVIVESPAKAKTIEKFLGKEFKVMSSQGHIRDLRKHDISVDTDGHFEPVYEISPEKKKLVAELKKAAKAADVVWLASDEDREGEAIAWHLAEVLGLDVATTRRIVFHAITREDILNAIAHPRTIDLNRVDAQQARRVLDRIVGFELSPLLWRKIKPSLSAGRVQSVAVRLICEREVEIRAFKPEPFFRVNAVMNTSCGGVMKTELSRRLPNGEAARGFLNDVAGATFTVDDIKVNPVKKSPAPPFTTSTLQQEAGRRLGMSVSTTMRVAQSLYEAGHITYMRTDSLNLSDLALRTIASEVASSYGKEYVATRRYHTTSKGAQEAHEAIRPTYVNQKHPAGLTDQEQRLYQLIWRRAVASQMADALLEKTSVEIGISTRPEHFNAQGEVVKFDGFLKVYQTADATDATEVILPVVKEGERLNAEEIVATERFTQAPPRYTETSLVKKLDELGIGRPSTYAPTISTIQERDYVERGEKGGEKRDYEVLTLKNGKITSQQRSENFGAEKGKLIPTDIGMVVNDYLTMQFPDILSYEFTARMEDKFDNIAEGRQKWDDQIADFYKQFHPAVETASKSAQGLKPGERQLGVDPKTGKPVSVKIGRYGAMVQIGEATDAEKPRFASLRPDQSVFDITLEEALKLFELPRTLGVDPADGKEVKAAVGRFGPYVGHNGTFASIPKDMSALEITLEQALALLEAKRASDAAKIVKTFDEDPDLKIARGRFGIYIAYKKKNYKIPKTVADPAALTLEECRSIIENQPAKPAARRSSVRKS